MYGTASTATNWILLEQPGPWGWNALMESRLARPVARALRDRARDLGARLVLLRRPGRHAGQGVHCYLVHSGPGQPWMQHGHLDRAEDLLEVDLSAVAAGQPPRFGVRDEEMLFLVCTNGARDRCCAERGRPTAAALGTTFAGRVWESAHIGGDRFAPNLISMPHGLYFGRVRPEDAVRIATDVQRGVIDLDHSGGRSCYGFEVQAAEYFARRDLQLERIDDLALEGRRDAADEPVAEVEFTTSSGRHVVVRIAVGPAEPPRLLTCKSTELVRPPRYEASLATS